MRSQTGVKPKRQKHPLFWHAIRDDNGLLERAVARLALYTKTAVAGFLCLPPATLTGMGVVQERKWTRRRAWSAFSTELVVSLFRQHGRAKGRLLRLRQVHGGRTTEHVARRPSYVLDVLERAEHMRERQQEKLDLKRQREATTIANAKRRARYAGVTTVPKEEYLQCKGCDRFNINPKHSNIRCKACTRPCVAEGCADPANGGRPRASAFRDNEDHTQRFCRRCVPERVRRQ